MHDIRKTPVFGYLRTENTYQEEIDEIDGLVVVNETTAVDEQIVLGAICHCNLLWNRQRKESRDNRRQERKEKRNCIKT